MKNFAFGILTLTLSAAALAETTTLIPDVAPAAEGQQVVINIPQQRLFVYNDGKLTKIYPVAVGKAMTQTNIGEHKIGAKAFNPTWHIPLSIQKERKDGVKSIPPGPKNPLGPVFVRLGDPKLGLGIHGTNSPSSVPGVRSHGCVRMKSPDALEFAKGITTGAPATVAYETTALNVDAGHNLILAAYKDPYNKKNFNTDALHRSIAAWAKANGKTINNKRVDAVLKNRTGAAVCLTCTKGVKIRGPLQSLAWNSGSANFTPVKQVPKTAPAQDEVLPTGSEIEIDAADSQPTAKPNKATATATATTNSRTISSATQSDAANNEGTDNLF